MEERREEVANCHHRGPVSFIISSALLRQKEGATTLCPCPLEVEEDTVIPLLQGEEEGGQAPGHFEAALVGDILECLLLIRVAGSPLIHRPPAMVREICVPHPDPRDLSALRSLTIPLAIGRLPSSSTAAATSSSGPPRTDHHHARPTARPPLTNDFTS